MRRGRKAQPAAELPADPLLAQLTQVQDQARKLGVARRQDAPGSRSEVLVTLADLSLLIDSLRATRDGLQHPLDANLAASRVVNAYRRTNALS